MWRCFLCVDTLDESGKRQGRVVDVEGSAFALGRDAEQCNVVLPHADVEPVHARIDVDPDNPSWRVFVRPECVYSSSSSSQQSAVAVLNGFPLWRTQPLHRGDVLSLGPYDVVLVDAGVVLRSTGERLSFCAASVDDVHWEPHDAKIRQDYAWFAEHVLHRPTHKR